MLRCVRGLAALAACFLAMSQARAQVSVRLLETPDYRWFAGCFGTATGNLMGYWDRHGFPNFYTGPTAGGVAPLNSVGLNDHVRSMWASQAGIDGRPADMPGHMDDYYVFYESTAEDPYVVAGRPEHEWDCIGDFIGLNQRKWSNLGDECEGNIDAYSFNFFDRSGQRRVNYRPLDEQGRWIPDIQSGLRAWTEHRGARADVFSQLADFNPDLPPSAQGFSFEDLRAEIDAGYPVLLFMQPFGQFSRTVYGMPNQNPPIHAMLAYGYYIDESGRKFVRYRTSWASGDTQFSEWTPANWTADGQLDLPLRGVIGYRPLPEVLEVTRTPDRLVIEWQGPRSILRNDITGVEWAAHEYTLEKAESLAGPWEDVASAISDSRVELPLDCCGEQAFFRLRMTESPSE